MPYDVAALRARFPALESGTAHFDGPGGSQVPDVVAAAVAAAMTAPIANRTPVTAAGRLADRTVREARAAVADLLGADPAGVVFGRSMTALTYELARAVAKGWGPGDEVVVTRLDHDANVSPWVQVAAATGATVRWVDFDPVSGELAVEAVQAALGDRTRLVAVTAASNLIGTRPDITAVAAAAKQWGAMTYVDGVHLSAHAPVDVASLGADLFACSPYKWLGPHCGVVVADPALLETIHPDKLAASTDAVPERFELGTLPYEMLAGVTAAVDFIAAIAPGVAADRRSRVLASMGAVEEHESALFDELTARLAELPGVERHGHPAACTPTALLTFRDADVSEVAAHLASEGVNAPAGSFYAHHASRHLGLGDEGGLRIGLAPYTDSNELDRLVGALASRPGRA